MNARKNELMKARKIKVLIVDDEPVVIASARKILSTEGFEVRTADSAEGAFESLRADTPDVVLVDLQLPTLSGLELLEIVKKEYPALAVIMMTGYTTEENAHKALEKGAIDFIPKPFSFEELLHVLARALEKLEKD